MDRSYDDAYGRMMNDIRNNIAENNVKDALEKLGFTPNELVNDPSALRALDKITSGLWEVYEFVSGCRVEDYEYSQFDHDCDQADYDREDRIING